MSDQKPPGGFSWNLGPAEPEDPAAATTPPPPAAITPPVAPPPPFPPAAPPPVFAPTPGQYAPPPAQYAPTPPPLEPPPTQAFPTGSYGFPTTQSPAFPPAAPPPPVVQNPAVPPVAQNPAPPQAPPPPQSWDQPTEAYAFGQSAFETQQQPTSNPWDQPTQAYAFDPSIGAPTELLGARPVGLPELRDESVRPTAPASAIDSLFGESQFREYEPGAFPAEGISALASTRPRAPRVPLGRTQKILFIVAGSLVAALLLVGVFFLGTKSPGLIPEPQAEDAGPVTSVAPAVAAAPVSGPVEPGTWKWNELLGGECLEPFGSAWDESYTVVDCTTPHAAQLVYRGYFADAPWAPFPGADVLQTRINLLCTAPVAVDYAVAGSLSDIAVSASYSITEDKWKAGERQYYCFLNRSTGDPLTVSLANPPVVDEAPVASVPSREP